MLFLNDLFPFNDFVFIVSFIDAHLEHAHSRIRSESYVTMIKHNTVFKFNLKMETITKTVCRPVTLMFLQIR